MQMKRTSDKHLFKVVVLAAFFAIVVYFQRKTVTSNVVEDLNRLEWQSSKHSDDSYLQAYRLSNQVGYKTRNLKWFTEGQNRRGVNLLGGSKNGTGSGDSDDSECSDVHKFSTADRCTFVKGSDDCQIDEGFIDYTTFVYCDFSPKLLPLALIILLLWWLFLFVGLAVTADDFFCPSLAVISDNLRLSHNIAGVTFLAFGNGAPDIFSAIAAIGNAKNGDAGLAFGALFGAGVFVTTVVAGTIAIIHPFDAMQRPFLRDIIFYLAATFWAFQILWKKEITKYEAIGFILLYVLYVLVVVVGRYIRTRSRTTSSGNIQDSSDFENSIPGLPSVLTHPSERDDTPNDRTPLLNGNTEINADPEVTEFTPTRDCSPLRDFLDRLNPIEVNSWSDMNLFKKIYSIFKSPLTFFLIVTVPVVNLEEEKHNWNRYLYCVQLVLGPVFSVLATKVGFSMIGGHFPAWALTLILGVALAFLVFLTSKNEEPPKYHAAFAYLGFVVAVVWIYSIANEIVNILQTLGVVFSISNAILGLTLLAWGNSLGDFIADTVMARQGFPRMGISACFGGPLFNLLLGVGIPFTIATIKQGGTYQLKITLEEVVLAGFVGLSLVSSLIIVPLSRFKMTRAWGIYLVVLYVIFLVVAILTETNLKITLEEVVLAGFVGLSLVSSLIIVPLSRFKLTRAWGIYLMVLYVIFLVVAILTETGVIHAAIDGNKD